MKFKVGDKVRIVKNTGNIKIKDKYIGQIMTIGCNNLSVNFPYSFEPDIGWAWAEADLELVQTEKIVITHDGKTTTTATMYHDDTKTVATARCAPEDEFDFNVGATLAMKRLMEIVNPVISNGFKVGDRVHVGDCNGTVICIADDGDIGVEFDDEDSPGTHNCEGVPLKAGEMGTMGTSKWYPVYGNPIELGECTPKYYNGKMVCIYKGHNDYTEGKIYTVTNGVFKDDIGCEIKDWKSPFKSFNDIVKFSSAKWIEIKE